MRTFISDQGATFGRSVFAPDMVHLHVSRDKLSVSRVVWSNVEYSQETTPPRASLLRIGNTYNGAMRSDADCRRGRSRCKRPEGASKLVTIRGIR